MKKLINTFFSLGKKPKPVVTIVYPNLQTKKGVAHVGDTQILFVWLEVTGDRLLLYTSDNGLTGKGRVGAIYDLKEYDIKFLNN